MVSSKHLSGNVTNSTGGSPTGGIKIDPTHTTDAVDTGRQKQKCCSQI